MTRGVQADWDRIVPRLSEEGLLLAETAHRVANEISSALAAMRLARGGRGRMAPGLVDAAIERLEGFGAVTRVLRIAAGVEVDLAESLVDLCNGLCASRDRAAGAVVTIDAPPMVVDGGMARRLLMIVAELVHNALRHALEGCAGRLRVTLRTDGRDVRLVVSDNGPGLAGASPSPGGGMGRHVVAELVRRGGGTMACRSGPRGTWVDVAMPIEADEGAGAPR